MKTTQTIKIEREYITSDLCLAVILKMNGCAIKKIEPLDQKRFVFHFEETAQAESITKEYFLLQTNDHPHKKFYNEMREIKNMIYNYKQP